MIVGRWEGASNAIMASSAATPTCATIRRPEPEKTPDDGYHLTTDLVDMIADAKQVAPNKTFFMYLALGATHSPHHVPKEWADAYRGEFDAGWDAYRKQVFAQQKNLGIIPAD